MGRASSKPFAPMSAITDEVAGAEIVSLDSTSDRNENPIELFQTWFEEAAAAGVKEPSAMSVATVDTEGNPDARMMLLKSVDERGFVFFTNLGSVKVRALACHPRAALCFYWAPLDRQVRVRGRVEPVTDKEADDYFATRPRLSQISAWASKQSQPMRGYFDLETAIAKTALRFGLGAIPRPAFWSGFRVVPDAIEFWIQKPFRRHQRFVYFRNGDHWTRQWLYP